MAQAAGRSASIFASVFPPSIKAPRTSAHNKRVKSNADPVLIKQELINGLKPLLGIDTNSRYAFGLDGPTAEGQPFLLPVNLCQPMRLVRRPNQADFLQQRSRFLKSSVWKSLDVWKSQLGLDHVGKLLAEVLDRLLGQYVGSAYKGVWIEDAVAHLEFWVQYVFTGIVRLCLDVLQPSNQAGRYQSGDQVLLADVDRWKNIALTALGALRVEELFDMIVAWDEKVNAIDDLKHFMTSPATRSYVTTRFNETLSSRLLHPGASTIEILQHYISIIRAFRKLDPKGVLLDRVARSVRKYLKDRDDTVRVIVTGLLSDPYDANGQPVASNPDTLSELALELIRRDESLDREDDNELDWDNMDWQPDPIDAAPDYMKSKNTDVIGSLTSLFESKDIFVKELQTTLADRLLKNKPDFALEITVVNHLKQRFGDTALQGCEVMLRDVLDSRKVDEVIRKEQATTESSYPPSNMTDQPELHAKILSRLFWPTMSDQSFKLPPPILNQQASYEKGFETLKQSRKLTWLDSIGHVDVELQLEDRTLSEEVLPYQASVIYAFTDQSDASSSTTSGTKPQSVEALATSLDMTPALVRSACLFWLSKRVLIETSPDHFSVLERLPSSPPNTNTTTTNTASSTAPNPNNTSIPQPPVSTSTTLAAEAAASLAASTAAAEAETAQRKQKLQIYHQFILSMLTNQGAMPLGRIAMMLGIVVPGGFPFGNEELKEFLAGMVKSGEVEVGMGGNYRVV